MFREPRRMENLSVISPVASACGNRFVGVARPAHFVRGPSRSCAVGAVSTRGAQFSFGLPSSSVVSSISDTVQWTCCVTHMTRTPQWLKKNCPCHPSTIHCITHGSGAWLVVLIRMA